jgi:hypothetical protein
MFWVRISIGARCTTLCDTVCQWLAPVRYHSKCKNLYVSGSNYYTIIILSEVNVCICLFIWWCLTSLSTIFQLYRGGQSLIFHSCTDLSTGLYQLFAVFVYVINIPLLYRSFYWTVSVICCICTNTVNSRYSPVERSRGRWLCKHFIFFKS